MNQEENCNMTPEDNYVSMKAYVDALFAQYKEAHSKEHEMLSKAIENSQKALEKAVDTAQAALNIRLEAMNEFRSQILSERGTFLTSEKFDAKIQEIENVERAKTESKNLRLNALETGLANLRGRWAAVSASIAVVLMILELLLRFVVK
jgi:preprotein translocase subunit SecA